MSAAELNVHILLALAAVIAAAWAMGWLVSLIGQPRVHGEILAGILLGPSLLGALFPGFAAELFPTDVVGALKVLAQIGLVLFMFLIGIDLDVSHLRGNGHKAVVVSHASIIVPMVLGGLLAWWLYPRFGGDADQVGFMLFMGAAMAITAFPVLARVLQETGLTDTRLGVLAITCAAIDDVTAWCVLAGVVAVVESSGFAETARTVVLALLYVAVALGPVKRLFSRRASVPLWLALVLALLSAWITEQIGIHAIFGAFVAGAVLPRTEQVRVEIHDQLERVTVTFLLPVFFVVVGLATRIDLLDDLYLWGITVVVILTAVAGKWGGSMLAARAVGETWEDAAALGILMNTRGLTELVILTVGLELEVISPTIFTIMVLMALVTTLMATPMLALVAPSHHRRKAEVGAAPAGGRRGPGRPSAPA